MSKVNGSSKVGRKAWSGDCNSRKDCVDEDSSAERLSGYAKALKSRAKRLMARTMVQRSLEEKGEVVTKGVREE